MDEDVIGMSGEQLIEEVPTWPEFIRGCVRYRRSLDERAPNVPRSSRPFDR